MAHVEWSAPARDDLKEIFSYIAADNPAAAWEIFDEIEAAGPRLEDNPKIGREGLVTDTRELVIRSWLLIYDFDELSDRVTVRAVVHQKRNWPKTGRSLSSE